MTLLADLTCSFCPSDKILSIKPGADPEYGMALDLFDREDKRLPRILIRRAVPTVCWCTPCWTTKFRSDVNANPVTPKDRTNAD